MEHISSILSNGIFYCSHLGNNPNDEKDIMDFSISASNGQGLKNYLLYSVFLEEENNYMHTYFIRDISTNELVCYFSLKAGLISFNEISNNEKVSFDTLPGIELANFAVNDVYIHNHPNAKGIGLLIFLDFIIPIVRRASIEVGVRIIYIFVLPFKSLINRYRGFKRLSKSNENQLHGRINPSYDENCIFMYQMV